MYRGKISRPSCWFILVLATNSFADSIRIVSPSQYAEVDAPGADVTSRLAARAQQVFPSEDFPSTDKAYSITEFAWRPDARYEASPVTIDELEIRMATTSADPKRLSATFDNNFDMDKEPVVVFDGPIVLTSNNNVLPSGTMEFDQVFALQTPFHYDPSDGNLLVEFRTSGGDQPTYADFFGSPPASFMYGLGPDAATAIRTHGGFVTQFTLIPEIQELQACDADQDLDFDQLDLVHVQIAAKYLTGQPATSGE